MKLKRRRAAEVPPKIKSYINSVTSTPLEDIEKPLKIFVWEFEKGDFHQWGDLFNHFDTFFEKCIKPRKDLLLDDNCLESEPPFPKEAVLQILRVIRIILENCTNKHLYSSYEQHLSALLSSTDADVVEASLETLAAFLKKTIGRYIIRDNSLKSKLFAFAQGWGGKEEGLGLVACAVENGSDNNAQELGCTLHYEFYSVNESSDEQSSQGLKVIHLPDVNTQKESDLELLNKLAIEYHVPLNLRFTLLTRLKFARAFSSLASRQQYTCIRLYAYVVLVQACSDGDNLVSFFNAEPEFINELVTLLSYEDAIPEKIRILSILSLIATCQDRARQPSVLTAVTTGGHRGILSSLMQKAIDAVASRSSKLSVAFAEVLLSLVTVLVSSSSGCSAMREAGFIPTLLPLLKDMEPQHLHLVSMAVHVLEAFMDYSNPAAALFRDLGGLDDTIMRLKVEVSHVESCSNQPITSAVNIDCSESSSSQVATDSSSDQNIKPLYSEALVSYHRRLLMKSLLRAISLGTYAPGATARVSGSEESMLPQCLCIIFKRAKEFGGGVFSLAATVMSDLIHKDPTCFGALEAAGLPSTFMTAIMDGVLCSSEAIICIPQCLDALCLNNNGLQAVKDHNALRCFVKIFTSKAYLRSLTGDTPGSLSSGLDELMRHASSLRGPGVEMLIEILNDIAKLGSVTESPPSNSSPSSSGHVPMETDSEDKGMVSTDGEDLGERTEQAVSIDASLANVESFLPEFISNAARLLETILQNSDSCRIFVEKKGIEAVLQLFTLPLMPLSVSIGHSISIAFKNFSPQHSVSLARAVCLFLREHLQTAVELLVSVGGVQLVQIEEAKRSKVLRCLSSLEGLLCLASSLLKATTTVISELGTADSDVLKDLGRAYMEVLWQISVCCDSKVDEKKNIEAEAEGADASVSSADASVSSAAGRESDDDANIASYRYINPVTVRTHSHSQWEREFISVVRSSEGFNRRSRHGLNRLRGGRTGRYLEALQIDSESMGNVSETAAQDLKKKSPEVLVLETLTKLASTVRSFFTALVKGFTSPNRRRTETGSLSSASKIIGSALSKVFYEALGFSGHLDSSRVDSAMSVKCRYLGKVVDDMLALTFDCRRRTCYTVMINNFYVHGTFKELLTTFEATSQLLWTPESAEEGRLPPWLLDTLQSYCRLLEYFVSSTLLLSPTSASQAQLLVQQPVDVGLSIGLFPVPKDPEGFVRMLQSQVLDVVLPVWNHPSFPTCNPAFVASIISLITHVYCGVGDVKRNRSGLSGSTNQRIVAPPPDEATIDTIVEMGFSRARAEEALRRVEANSVEMAMEWLFSHAEDPVQEDDELARALALSLGSSSESSKVDSTEKSVDVLKEEGQIKTPPVDDILSATMKLFEGSETMAFQLTDLLVILCNRNKGEDRNHVVSYLVQQLKMRPVDFSQDNSALCMISHTLALILCEDESARRIAVQSGTVTFVIDVLMNFKSRTSSGNEHFSSKCISALLLILDNLLQSRPRLSGESAEETTADPLPVSSEEHVSSLDSEAVGEKKPSSPSQAKESCNVFEKVFGKSTGLLTMEESCKVLIIACDLIKQHVPSLVMQAVLQLCARLTKHHVLAMQFLESGSLIALFGLPRSSFFPGYDTLASAIVRHLIEDPQTLQTAMELEIRQTLTGGRHGGRISVRTFLTSLSPVIARDPGVFMKAANAVCQLESSGGRTTVVLLKERDREKEKEKLKAVGPEPLLSSSDSIRMSDNKGNEGQVKCSKSHKKVPVNLTQVVDHLLEIVLAFPSLKSQEDAQANLNAMEVDEATAKLKGKSKVDETRKAEMNSTSEQSAGLAKVTFVLKLLSDILLMYVHTAGVILRRDLDMSQHRGSNQLDSSGLCGIIHHVLHRLLPLTMDKNAGPDDWREKLSEKASYLLVILSSRSGEGRKRVINELAKALAPYSNSESNSLHSSFMPNKKVLAFVDLVYAILSKNSPSVNLPSSGCSPDVARCMIDGGIAQCLSGILQVIDLDHPDAPKIVNFILKSLESLTRAANASEQLSKSESLTKKEVVGGRSDENIGAAASQTAESNDSGNRQQGAIEAAGSEFQPQEGSLNENNPGRDSIQSMDLEMRIEESGAANPPMELGLDYVREDMEESGDMQDRAQIGLAFHVENRDDMGDEDDDMGDDGEDDEDDDDGEEEDEEMELGGDGTALMSLADTDVEDHEEAGLGDEYNEDMADEDDDDYPENRVIEVRWREALDGLDHLQVLGQPGTGGGLIDVTAEPFEGVNVDDFFGLRRTFGFERRRQINRTSFERPTTDGTSLQHPLLSRPSQSSELVSMLSGTGNSSRDMGALTSGNLDVSQLYMFHDAPVLPFDNPPSSLFDDHRVGGSAPPPLSDFTVGLESLRMPGRRGAGDSRWTDVGHPQAGGEAASIAQAIEGQFLSQMTFSTSNNPGTQFENTGLPGRQTADTLPSIDGQLLVDGGNPVSEQNIISQENGNTAEQSGEGHNSQDGGDAEIVEAVIEQAVENQLGEPATNLSLEINAEALDIMETEEENGDFSQQLDMVDMVRDLLDDPVAVRSPNSLQPHDVGHRSPSATDSQSSNHALLITGMPDGNINHTSSESVDVDMNGVTAERDPTSQPISSSEVNQEPSSRQVEVIPGTSQADEGNVNNEASNGNGIDPTFLEALPEDLRAEVLASQQAQSSQPPTYAPPTAEDIDPEFLAALPPEIQAEVLAQQRVQRVAQQAAGQPVEMDNASIIATFPSELREEVLLTSSEAVLSALPSTLLAEAQMLRDRAMSHYQARSLFGGSHSHRFNNRRNGLGFDRNAVIDRGVGVTMGRRVSSSVADTLKLKELEGEPLLDADSLKALIRLLRLAQPLGKGLLQRLLLNLCAHSSTRANLVHLLLDTIKPEYEGSGGRLTKSNSLRLYGCQSNLVYGRSQLFDGLPPLVLRRILEILTYLANNHSSVASLLFYFDPSLVPNSLRLKTLDTRNDKGKDKLHEGDSDSKSLGYLDKGDIPLILFLRLLSQPLFLRSTPHLEQVMGLLQVIVYTAVSKLENQSLSKEATAQTDNLSETGNASNTQKDPSLVPAESSLQDHENIPSANTAPNCEKSVNISDIFLQLPQPDLHNLCSILGHEGLSDKIYMLAGEVLKKLASVAAPHRKFFITELSGLAQELSSSAVNELITLRQTNMLGLSAGSMAGAAVLRLLQTLSSFTSATKESSFTSATKESSKDTAAEGDHEEHATMWKLNVALEPLWQELSECISSMESELTQSSFSSVVSNINMGEPVQGSSSVSSPLPPGTQRLLPFIEAFFVLCEKLQAHNSFILQEYDNATAREVKESAGSSVYMSTKCTIDSHRKTDGTSTFTRFSERHRRLLNAFIRQNPGLLEKSLSMLLKAPRLIDFDNKRAYFRSRIRQQHDQHLSGPLRISVRRAYVLEDSYNQLRMRPTHDLKGRLNVHFQGEEGIDAGGLTREWYQLLSRVIFDKGALLFTTVGNNATFQPNPNSVYQTEHLSYFKFIGRVVAKALFDGQLLDVYFTRSFYKHILGVKVTYHDIEAVDPDYYKNLKWMLENDVSDIPDLTFSMDADEEKHILYEKTEVTDYELKSGGRNIRVTEETKHEYVDLVADHILTNAIRPQITSFLEGFNELVPKELISIFNDKELELLISGLPEIDLDDLKANTEYTGYTSAATVVQWFWDVVKAFSKEDMARLLQFVTGTSKVPLDGFKALQGISGPQRFQIHKAYGAPERLPSAHTCFNQLDLPEYATREQLQERLLLAIHEASEGFGFG